MEKWEDRKVFSFPHLCLVKKVEKWRDEKLFGLVENKICICRGTIWWPNPCCSNLGPKDPTQWIFVEYGLKNSSSVSFNGLMHGLREYTNKNENATLEKSPGMIRLKTWLIDTDQCSLASLQYSPSLFHRPLSWEIFTYYIGPFISSGLYTCWSSKLPLEHLSHQTPLSILCELR